MIATDINKTATVRNVFVIDDKGIIRLILVYPMNVGRCIPEILRAIQALQVADCSNGATPANWVPCNQVIKPIPKTFDQLLERNEELAKNRDGLTWYLGFKKPDNCCKKLNDNSENT